uniref:1-acyl-sn-glycerol-3-phosphate acyltransferase n=1 Tax=Candidatus Aschnera chinzeii TaxID=1485666 RepID=A0AAT9G533_9ENTR|nr:MAG: 1-acylglycerol-3-phosphate O-acyltransferase [Candidatus Aschnera chinzeii]
MLAILRIIIVISFGIIISIIGCCYCLLVPNKNSHAMLFGRIFGKLSFLFGIKIIQRIPTKINYYQPSIYISNHQNNYDMIILSNLVQPNTVTLGKKNIIFIPFFGQLYWLTGNIFIDRFNKIKALNTIKDIIHLINKKKKSIWIFPEGTRNYGKGLLPFKNGAFYIAISSGIPIIPVCSSNTQGQIKLNRWNNGKVIIEMLPPIDTKNFTIKDIHKLKNFCYQIINNKIMSLNEEVKNIDNVI